jgi:hypothetical protein
MMYAWAIGEKDRTNLAKRIRADQHQGQEAVCPLHGCRVLSHFFNGVWQWVHVGRASRA